MPRGRGPQIGRAYDALYSIYDMYTDLFADGPRKPKVGRLSGGALRESWHNGVVIGSDALSTEPIYSDGQRTARQGTLGRELQPRIPAHAHYGFYI